MNRLLYLYKRDHKRWTNNGTLSNEEYINKIPLHITYDTLT